jgi:choline dehydrogenase-like flavoprotein
MSRQFAVAGDRAARGAFMLEFLNSAGGTPAAIAARSGLWGTELKKHVQEQFGRRLGIRAYCEQLPDRDNVVVLDPHVRDQLGMPVPHLRYSVGPYERSALDEAREVARRILAAAGCDDIRTSGLGLAAHQIGTHRMGADPATSVVNADLRAHDVPNLYLVGAGAFVTASASPPTLTIAALAIRAAERIAHALRPGAPPLRESHRPE